MFNDFNDNNEELNDNVKGSNECKAEIMRFKKVVKEYQ
jgi:hypothetical protein